MTLSSARCPSALPVPAAPPGRPRGLHRWHRFWRTWTRHRWRALCPAALCHRVVPHHTPPPPAAPQPALQPGESTAAPPAKAPGRRMTCIMGSERGRTLSSRTVTAFLSLKTDFRERRATWHGPVSWRGHKHHSLEARGWGCSPKVPAVWRSPQAPALPPSHPAPLAPPTHLHRRLPSRKTQEEHHHLPSSSAAEGTRALSLEPFGWVQMSVNAGLGRIWAK